MVNFPEHNRISTVGGMNIEMVNILTGKIRKVIVYEICIYFIVLMFGEYVFAQSGVIAHRGFWKTDGSAQNSIAALLKADSVGCYGSEFDICLTKDNKWVVAHGPAVGGHKIAESTLEELTVLKLEMEKMFLHWSSF